MDKNPPPLEPQKKPLIYQWWFLGILFILVFTISTFLILIVQGIREIQRGEYDFSDSFTQDISAESTDIERANVVTSDDPSLGPKDAKVTIVEFGDFQCPFCREVFPTVREVLSLYEGQIRYIWRDFPVSSEHPQAALAASAGECVAEQDVDKFWSFHDQLFINQSDLSQEALIRYAQGVGVDVNDFSECLLEEKYLQEVIFDYNDGIAAGVTGTPTFFINGRRISGVIPLNVFKDIIDIYLQE
ncbi:DsbA family protein [Patescibacteria group bacterium]